MPTWAAKDAGNYWDAADLYERANGRLYISADFALPRDLSLKDQVALAHDFAQQLTTSESLPYTLAIHSGRDADGNEHNPHAHLMISERKNDGIERSPEKWFSRANPTDPTKGGAAKSRTFHGREWVENARERWAGLTNKTMARLGREERVDHRSYERQGIDQEAGEHFGPKAAHMVARGEGHDASKPLRQWSTRGSSCSPSSARSRLLSPRAPFSFATSKSTLSSPEARPFRVDPGAAEPMTHIPGGRYGECT